MWYSCSPLSSPRSHPAVAVYDGKIYSFGGGGFAFKSLNASEVYDPKTDQWSPLRPMPTTRSGALAVAVGDAVYVMGGGFKKPDGKFTFLKTVEVYLPKEDRWAPGPDLLQPHDYPAGALVEGEVYIIGGHHPDATAGGPQTDPAFSFSERWDFKSDRWEEISPMPTPRFAASAVAINNRLWVLGGVAAVSEGFHEYDVIEIFAPQEGKWHPASMTLPWPSAGQGACLLDNRLYILGGFREGEGIGAHGAVNDLAQKPWSALPPMPEARAAMGVAVIDQDIYLIGGWRADRSVMDSVAVLSLH
ncbi:MAG: Kelch repeat-containing protein [Nitrospiria bacterium]